MTVLVKNSKTVRYFFLNSLEPSTLSFILTEASGFDCQPLLSNFVAVYFYYFQYFSILISNETQVSLVLISALFKIN